jgi:hypothetical protein
MASAHYQAPDWMTKHVLNKLVLFLTRLGISARGSRVSKCGAARPASLAAPPSTS